MPIRPPYLLFLGDGDQAKTATGVAYWRPELCAGQLRMPGGSVDLNLPDLSPEQAAARGVKTLLIGVAPHGGQLPEAWTALIVEALQAGLDVAAGLHTRIAGVAEIASAAKAHGRTLFDVRHPDRNFAVASGKRRPGRRLLTVGTDCEVGKMFTALALERELRRRGRDADFRATGQTGIFIAGRGVSVDAVVSDFVAGAAEWLSPANEPDHWDLIEGQGSIFHPAYAGVTLSLIHGSQPDALVLCHDASRRRVVGYEDYPIQPFAVCIDENTRAARLTNPDARLIGMSVNTSTLGSAEASAYLAELEDDLKLPCVDPVRTGVGRLADLLEAWT